MDDRALSPGTDSSSEAAAVAAFPTPRPLHVPSKPKSSAPRDDALFSEDDELLGDHERSTKRDRKARKKRRHSPESLSLQGDALKIGAAPGTSSANLQHLESPHSTAGSAAGSAVREKLSVVAVIVHLCKGNIGPGAMSLPNGFSQAGIYAAPVLFVVVVRFADAGAGAGAGAE